MRFFVLPILLFVLAPGIWGQSIEGPEQVCLDECYTYRLQPVDADAIWQVTAPDGSDVPFTYSTDSTEIEVCFSEVGIYTLSLDAEPGSGRIELNVFSGDFTDPVLELVGPLGCENPWLVGQNCIEVCYGQLITLRVRDIVFTSMDWSVSGPGNVVTSSPNEITIQLDSVTGNLFIGYFGRAGDDCVTEGGKCLLLVEPPEAEIGSAEFGIISDSIEICQGQRVHFENESNAPAISWGLSLGASGDGEAFQYRFSDPGIYELSLTVGVDCSCTAVKTISVIVNPTPAPEIQCLSDVCQGDTALYETQAGCAPYQWTIEGMGTVHSGGGPNDEFMEVIWTGGSTGWVELEHACAEDCPSPARERIEILGSDMQIEGRTEICPGEVYSYRVPSRDGTRFTWSANGGNFQGSSLSNVVQLSFNAFTSNPYVAVEIDDCTRGCVQQDTLFVNRVNPFLLEGPTALCFGSEGSWQTTSGGSTVSSFWQLTGPDGSVVDSSLMASSSYAFTFTQEGRYTLVAQPQADNYCSPFQERTIIIRPPLPAPGDILGADTICPGNSYWYEMSTSLPSGATLEWVAIQDADSSIQSGNPIREVWQSNTDKTLLSYYRDLSTGCISEVRAIDIEEIGTIEIVGPDSLCRGLEGIFHLQGAPFDEVSWSVDPGSGARIIDQMGQDSIRVLFSQSGTVEITAAICGQTAMKSIRVLAPAALDVSALESVGCGIEFTEREVDGSLYDSLFWYENGNVVSTQERTELRRGQRNMLVVYDAFGCRNHEAFSIPFTDFERPKIRALGSVVFCNGGILSIVHDLSDTTGLDLVWYQNNMIVAENLDTLSVTESGIYRLEVTERSTGCTLESTGLLICESCDPNPDSTVVVCPSIPGGGMNTACDPSIGTLNADFGFFVDSVRSCNQIVFTVEHPDAIPNTAQWRYSLGGIPTTTVGDSVIIGFDEIGDQSVYVSALGINSSGDTVIFCPQEVEIFIPGQVNIRSISTCFGDSTVFQHRIELANGVTIDSFLWTFGDGEIENSELSPTHVYPDPDLYFPALSVALSAGCDVRAEIVTEVLSLPNAAWAGDSSACANTLYEVEALGSAEFFEWRFGNPLPDSLQAIQPQTGYRFDSAGLESVQLTVEDLLGCRQDSLRTVVVNSYSGADSIAVQPDLPACEGSWVELSVVGAFRDLLWSNGSDSSTVLADRPGSYEVTVTDDNGCQNELGPLDIEYATAPNAQIRAFSLSGGGRYSGDTLEICVGQAVELRLLSLSDDYTLNWSVGGSSPVIRYDGNVLDLLDEGLFHWELTVTDTTTMCSATSEFSVRVNPQPDPAVIVSNQSPPYCAGDMIELRVDNPQPALDYEWSTGATGQNITVSNAQAYRVSATNAFGCESESAPFFIHPRPDVGVFPLGCYANCGEVEICLPLQEGTRLVEWTRNGQAEPIPSSLDPLRIDSSGQYAGVIANAFDCEEQTDSIRFDIFFDAGLVNGQVFLDRNGDDIFNMGDSLLSGVPVWIIENGMVVDSTLTDSIGEYLFDNVPLGDYTVELNGSGLPANWSIVRGLDSVQLTDCGQEEEIAAFILQDCPSLVDSVDLTACSGDSVQVDGIYYRQDTVIEIIEIVDDCPQATVYDLLFFPGGDTTDLQQLGCTGDTLTIMGISYTSDTLLIQNFANRFGCDSTVSLELIFQTEPVVDTLVALCPGDSALVNGNWYLSDTSFSYTGSLPGLDCEVRFDVDIRQVMDWDVVIQTEDACPGASDGSALLQFGNRNLNGIRSIEFDGQESVQLEWLNLAAGSYLLTVEDTSGCAYSATVDIAEREAIDIFLPEITVGCEDESSELVALYQGGDSTGLSYAWENGVSGPVLSVQQAGEYLLQVETECETLELIGRVSLDPEETGLKVFVPNVFSPNQDGINDVFQPSFSNPAALESYQLQIFDRWGALLYESQTPTNGWDGQHRELLMSPGVYVWRMEWTSSSCAGGSRGEEGGSITLVR